ncbi:MAG: tetratricopeptide repeat protein [Bacteroidetes bacterium]|nr:tetratricopeptide repeat protein [Bacteroidota bacterium]
MIQDFYKNTECLSAEQLDGYLNKKLSVAEVREVELHLAGCPLCSDAVDGMMEMEHKELTPVIAAELHKAIDARVSEKKVPDKIIPFPQIVWKDKRIRYAVAASFLLIIVAGIILKISLPLQQKEDKSIAQNTELERAQNGEETVSKPPEGKPAGPVTESSTGEAGEERVAADELSVSGKRATGATAGDKNQEEKKKGEVAYFGQVVQTTTETKVIPAEPATLGGATGESKPLPVTDAAEEREQKPGYNEADMPVATRKEETSEPEKEIALLEEQKKERDDARSKKTVARDAAGAAKPAVAFSSVTATQAERGDMAQPIDSAVEKYNSKDYKGALAFIEQKVLPPEQYNYDGLFYAGMSAYNLNDCRKAVEYFEKVIQIKSLKHYHEALYRKAECHLKLNEKDKARQALGELSSKENRYRLEAKEMLKTME